MDLSEASWRKSSRSSAQGDQCVEVAAVPGVVAIRDSKDPDGPRLVVERNNFHHITAAIKNTP
ncbi:DUF397 domain-containing protein [Actinomadura kijaniata]|uniref:DUF397 domain-containing protein n=1 Tax=Actinomadura kijaniata TaxID=46161 RepID=UPI0009FF4A7A|nr:DUF397 domain-containing protein [Actinomadura kijaniata]